MTNNSNEVNEKFTPLKLSVEYGRYAPTAPIFGFNIKVEGKIPVLCSTGIYQHNNAILPDVFNNGKYVEGYFSDTEAQNYAELIVKAVNSYDSLIEENKQLKLELDSWKKENFDNVEMAAETIKDLQSVNKMLLEALKDITESYKYCVKKADQSEWFIKANFAINKAESE